MASSVEGLALLIQVQILEISTGEGNCGVGRTHIALVVTGDEMLRTANPDAGSSILNVELEAPALCLVH